MTARLERSATAAGASGAAASNPLLAEGALPEFAAIRPEHVEPAMHMLLAENRERIAQLASLPQPSFDAVVAPLEEMQHRLTRTWSPVSHLNAVVNSEELRRSYNACLPLLSDYQTDLTQSEPLYRAFAAIDAAASSGAQLSPEQRRVVSNALRDFRLAGVALDGPRKQRFKQIMSELAQASAKFEENVLDSTNTWSHAVESAEQLRGVNEVIAEQAARKAREAGRPGWLFGLDQPTYVSIVTDAESAALRRAFYEAWTTRASDAGPLAGRWDNAPVIEQILRLRHEAARLLDFENYAAYALATRMARSTGEVLEFLRELAHAARPAALRELEELHDFARSAHASAARDALVLEPWDIAFYSERLQRERYSVSQEELRPYFALPRVLEGLFEVAQRLFDVRIHERTGVSAWHPDVRFFGIEDARGEPIGHFYLDPYARAHKRSGAWMDEAVGRKALPSGNASPVAHLVCNFLPPQGDGRPALLTHDDVVTLFHEFGHGLHHLLTRVPYPSIAGINGVAWDAVELPSQFLENYAWHPEVIARIARHFESGAPLPPQQQARLLATRSFQAGLATVRQLEFALFDFRLHAEYDPARGGRVLEILAQVRGEVAVIQPPPWNRMASSFGHIFAGGYAAGYYSYKWAEVLAADAFGAFEERGVFDRATAQRFLESILVRGGSRDPLEAFVEFRGRKPEIGPLLRQSGMLPAGR